VQSRTRSGATPALRQHRKSAEGAGSPKSDPQCRGEGVRIVSSYGRSARHPPARQHGRPLHRSARPRGRQCDGRRSGRQGWTVPGDLAEVLFCTSVQLLRHRTRRRCLERGDRACRCGRSVCECAGSRCALCDDPTSPAVDALVPYRCYRCLLRRPGRHSAWPADDGASSTIRPRRRPRVCTADPDPPPSHPRPQPASTPALLRPSLPY